MEPFTFNRQAIAFLCVLAVVDLAIVVTFPILAILFGAFAALLLLFVWVKTGTRAGKWLWWNPVAVPLTQIEGALALSAALLFSVGTIDAGYEWIRLSSGAREALSGYFFPAVTNRPSGSPVGSSSTMYSDPVVRQQFKDELAKAGIPYSVETINGEQYVVWTSQYDPAVKKIEQKIGAGPVSGNNMSFDDPTRQQEFIGWLKKRGIASEIKKLYGKDYVVWQEGSQELARQFIDEHSTPCPPEKSGSAPGC